MRKLYWLLLVLAGCSGADADPLDVAARFHQARIANDDPGIHALLTEADQAVIPLAAYPAALPPGIAFELFGWGDARVESASLLGEAGDTAAVLLNLTGAARDTLRLVASRQPRRLWRFELDRVRWRVALGLAEHALLDSLAASVRANADATDAAAVEHARAYLQAAERYPGAARPADVDAARATVRNATIAKALRIDVRLEESFTGTRFVGGRVENPTRSRVATLRLIVRDAAGAEEQVDLWDLAPGTTTPVWQLTRLAGSGPLDYRLARIQVF